MKTTIKILAVMCALLALAACGTTQPADNDSETTYVYENETTHANENEVFDINNDAVLPNFMSFSGTTVDASPAEDGYFLLLQCDETGSQVNFLIDFNTAFLTTEAISMGMPVVAYFDTTLPEPMIYPPQHRAVAIVHGTTMHVILDRFDENMQAYNSTNTLEIADDTEIVIQGNIPFEGDIADLAGRKLLVEFYEEGIVIVPAKITVLFEIAVPPIHFFSDEELEEMGDAIAGGPEQLSPEDIELIWTNMFDTETVRIIVNGEIIEAPAPFADSEAGTVMMPLIAVAEALGYTAVDGGVEVIISPGRIVTEGINSYARGREVPLELTSAPVVRDGVMFVPWEFFHEILTGAAYVEDGDIHVVTLDEVEVLE